MPDAQECSTTLNIVKRLQHHNPIFLDIRTISA